MPCRLHALSFDAYDPGRLARFWADFLGWETEPPGDPDAGVTLLPADDTGFRLRFVPVPSPDPSPYRAGEPESGEDHMHFDLTSDSPEDQARKVERALELGARHLDVGQLPEEGHVVLADPGGYAFCVIGPGNAFLAECGLIGALAGDGSQETGYFWSRALDWPLVWDQDQETAIRSPHGGPKLTWGGPPLLPKTGKVRLHFDLVPCDGSDQRTEVDRLLALGARRADIGQGDVDHVVLADPDGHEFCVLAPR